MHLETKATRISKEVALEVWKRDKQKCIVCGSYKAVPNSHVVRRSQGGMGMVENVVSHCLECHILYDSYDKEVREVTMDYIYSLYPDWSREKVTYSKWKK